MPERADLRLGRADSSLEGLGNLGPKRADLRPKRADLRPEKADMGSKRADFRLKG